MRNYEILLVDDDDVLVLSAVGDSLRSEEYVVTIAQSGEEAFDILGRKKFDLVITDLMMGKIDGHLVLQKTKELYPETMVIILTGHASIDSAIQAVKLKADDYLLKPCENEELNFRVQRCIETIEKNRKLSFYENILPVCMYCKSIRDDTGTEHGKGTWMSMEKYLSRKAGVDLSHTFCPQCKHRAMKDLRGD